MARSHIFRPLLNELGDLLTGATVTVREVEVAVAIGQPIWSAREGDSSLPNPFSATNGLIDIWLDTPQRVNLLIEAEGMDPISIYLDALPSASEIVRSESPLRILGTPQPGMVVVGTGNAGEASWQAYDPNAGWKNGDPNAIVGGATGTVGFFGDPGIAKPVISDDVTDNQTLASLLQYLSGLGLIEWTGTLISTAPTGG